MSNPLSCPKCGYERTASDKGPLTSCPKCKVVFAVYKQRVAIQDTPTNWSLLTFVGLLGLHLLLLIGASILYVGAVPIAAVTLILGGLPSLLFVLAQAFIPVLSFMGGVAAWRSVVLALLVGLPLVPLSTAVLTLADAGQKFMAVPVLWPTAVALGSASNTMEMLRKESMLPGLAFLAGLCAGLVVRLVFRESISKSALEDSDA
jgi:hypothetical protein